MRKADNVPPSCAVVTKSGNLKFLEPSGPLQACNGTALPLGKGRLLDMVGRMWKNSGVATCLNLHRSC